VVADFEIGHAGADFGDHTRSLVTAEEGEAGRGGTGDDVLVGVAHARRGELDGDLTRARITDLDLLDRPRLVESPEDCAFSLHVRLHALRCGEPLPVVCATG